MTRAEFIFIIQKSQGGDKKAFGKIYDEYFGKLYITAFQIVKNTDSAYDIASNVILKLLEFRHDATQIQNHIGYMLTMVRNAAKNFLNKSKNEIVVSEVWETNRKEVSDMLWIEDVFAFLTKEERELFTLHIVWDMTLNSAAKLVGITYGAAKSRYKKLKTKIKSVYKK